MQFKFQSPACESGMGVRGLGGPESRWNSSFFLLEQQQGAKQKERAEPSSEL
jgi:hypothetical protein